jgi:hypothetical protein
MSTRTIAYAFWLLVAAGSTHGLAADGFITTTFGNAPACEHRGTLKATAGSVRFDLSALPAGTKVLRATLHVPLVREGGCFATKVVPAGIEGAGALKTRPPLHRSFDATAAAAAWVARPDANQGLTILQLGYADFQRAVLEVSFRAALANAGPVVTGLKVEHRSGQTFLTWKEPEDVVGDDAPTWEKFEQAVLKARARRDVTYRVYRSDRPITVENLAAAELVREVPEATSCWYILAVKNTEHPGPGRKSGSPLRPGNLLRDDVVTRYRLADGGPPLGRGTGLAVLTATQPGRRYYAVTVAVDGREAVAQLTPGGNAAGAVEEQPARFPAIIKQRTRAVDPRHTGQSPVDLYVCWLEPPLVQFPRVVEIGIPRWSDLEPSAEHRAGLYLNLAGYGSTATEIGDPGWHGARRYVGGAVTVALAEEGTLWAGQHECTGTLRGYEDGVVWNYEQRRALAATAWAVEKPDFFIDPQRVYVWGQSAAFCLRYGETFAAVLCDGHNNYKTSKEGRKHAWRWGPPGGGKNWLGVNHLDYLDLPKWIRENPAAELPFCVVAPSYGSFPDHCLGDFGFKPWQEFLTAMSQTRRAFSATWIDNGFGETSGCLREMVPQIRLHQSLPAFSRCSLDARPVCDNPKGEYRPGKYDQDFQQHADKFGGINLWQRWDPAGILDEPDRWAVTVWLARPDKQGKSGSPQDSATTDLTPRRCQRFKAAPGERFAWTAAAEDGRPMASGEATADRWGLVTIQGLRITQTKQRVTLKRK